MIQEISFDIIRCWFAAGVTAVVDILTVHVSTGMKHASCNCLPSRLNQCSNDTQIIFDEPI